MSTGTDGNILKVLFGAGFLVLLAAAFLIQRFFSRRRTRAVREFARRSGLDFTDVPVPNFPEELLQEPGGDAAGEPAPAEPSGKPMSPEEEENLSKFGDILRVIRFPRGVQLYSLGRGLAYANNVVRGRRGCADFFLFDYEYTVPGGRSSRHYEQTVCHFQSEGLSLPGFAMRPERLWHKVGGAFGYQDIDFESHPRFSKSYLLRGKDEAAIRAAFRPEILSCFEGRPGLAVEGVGKTLIVYRTDRKTAVEDLQAFLDESSELLRLFGG